MLHRDHRKKGTYKDRGNFLLKKALYFRVNVFITGVLIGDTIAMSPTGDGAAILRGHPSYVKI